MSQQATSARVLLPSILDRTSPGNTLARVSKRYTRNMVAAAAAVLAASLGVTSALAATTWTVRPGGSISLKSGTLVMKDTRTGSTLSCTSTRFSGRLKSGGGRSGTGIGAITAGSFTNCTSPLGVTYFFTPTDLPWHVNFTSYHATNGVVTGNISHIQITQSSPGCAFVIDGTSATASDGVVTFTYANSTARLKTLPPAGTCTSTTSTAVPDCSPGATRLRSAAHPP